VKDRSWPARPLCHTQEVDESAGDVGLLVSHVPVDGAWAEWIAWQLRSVGYEVLVAAWDELPGVDWLNLVGESLSQGWRTIAVISAGYLGSAVRSAEWRAAYLGSLGSLRTGLFPVRVEDCKLPPFLNNIEPLDLFDLSESDAQAAFERLLGAISGEHRGNILRRPYPGPDVTGARGRSSADRWGRLLRRTAP